MEHTLQRLLWERIGADPELDDEAGLLVMAAAEGPEALWEALEGQLGPSAAPAPSLWPRPGRRGPISVRSASRDFAGSALPRSCRCILALG